RVPQCTAASAWEVATRAAGTPFERQPSWRTLFVNAPKSLDAIAGARSLSSARLPSQLLFDRKLWHRQRDWSRLLLLRRRTDRLRHSQLHLLAALPGTDWRVGVRPRAREWAPVLITRSRS